MINITIPDQINISGDRLLIPKPICEEFQISYDYNSFIIINFIISLMLFYHRKIAKKIKQEPQRILTIGITILTVFNTIFFLFQFLVPILNNWLVGI